MAKIHFETLGCRLNQSETERIAQGFVLAGHEIVSNVADADICVVNTCTVTSAAGAKSRRAARRARDDQHVIVTGCHSAVAPDDFDDADMIVSNEDKENLVPLVHERLGMDGLALGMDHEPVGRLQLYPLITDRTRAFVKIQDGCNLSCSFCLTTIARGDSRSRPVDEIVAEIQDLAEQGCQEAVLTGVHAGSYGHDIGTDLGDLMETILTETDIPRLRLSSLEPWNFKTEWLDVWVRYDGRLCRHLHMSLQSGSDSVLQRMRRAYRSDGYAAKVDAARAVIPGVAITADIIVGFPGETEEEHRESLEFVREMNFADAHIFTYSARPGTRAAQMSDQIHGDIRKQRYHDMKAVIDASEAGFRDTMIGATLPVLWEQRESDGTLSGLTDNYIRVHAPIGSVRPNTITKTRLDRANEGRIWGQPLEMLQPA